eukprot:252213-Amphidinium_carterae.1
MKALSLNALSSKTASSPVSIGGLPSFSGSIFWFPPVPPRALCSSCAASQLSLLPVLVALSQAFVLQLSAGSLPLGRPADGLLVTPLATSLLRPVSGDAKLCYHVKLET